MLAAGCDAGIRYDERLEQDMIAVPIGPRVQRFADGASPPISIGAAGQSTRAICSSTLPARPVRERRDDGLGVRARRRGREGRSDRAADRALGAATDLAVDAAIAGTGIVHLFEDWLRPHLDSGALEPVLEPWWQRFSGPFLYYPGRRHVPAPLRAFVDFIKASARPTLTSVVMRTIPCARNRARDDEARYGSFVTELSQNQVRPSDIAVRRRQHVDASVPADIAETALFVT